MKRRMTALMLAAGLVCASAGSSAAGMLTVTHQSVVQKPEDRSVYYYARVENTGDAPIAFRDGTLVLFPGDDPEKADTYLLTDDYVAASPEAPKLSPGDAVYVYHTLRGGLPEGATVGSAVYTPYPQDEGIAYDIVPLPCEFEETSTYLDDVVHVTVTNDSAEIMQDFDLVVTAWAKDDALDLVTMEQVRNFYLYPGSTVTLKVTIPRYRMAHFPEKGRMPDRIEAILYIPKSE